MRSLSAELLAAQKGRSAVPYLLVTVAVSDELAYGLGMVGSIEECRDRLAEEEAAGINLHSVTIVGESAVEEGRIIERLLK